MMTAKILTINLPVFMILLLSVELARDGRDFLNRLSLVRPDDADHQ